MRFRLCIPFVVLCLITPCFAWNGEGHQIVALIAEDHLSPEAKAAISQLLDDAQISDAEIANWAHEESRQRTYTAPWHYVNIPTDAEAFDRQRDGQDGDNVIDAIEKQANLLADKTAPKEDRADALKFVVHLIGDVHQPLHCADRNGDKGGNKQLVFYPGLRAAKNLHSVWDGLLLRDAMNKQRVAAYAEALDKRITPKQRKEWAAGTPEQWANESHRVAVEHAYAGIPADGPPPKLSTDYVTKNAPIVADRMMRAGVRLAFVLNRALGSTPTTSPSKAAQR